MWPRRRSTSSSTLPKRKTAAGDHDGAHLGGLPLAQHGVQGEEQGGQDGQHHAEKAAAPAPQDGDGQNPQHLQHQGQDVVPPDGLPEKQEGQNRDKDGVAGEDHRHHIGVAADQGQLVEHHGQGHAEEPGDGEGPQVFGGEFPLLPVQGPGGHRQQEEAADQETARVICMGWKAPSTAGSFRITSMVEKIKVANPMQTQPNKKFCFPRIPLPPVARPKIVHGSL